MKTLKELTEQAQDLLEAIAFDAANGAITAEAFNAHLASYDQLQTNGRFAILHSTTASVEESDDKLIASHRLNGAISSVLLALSTLKPIVEKHGRAFPPPSGDESAAAAIRQRGPNEATLHISVSGGPFIGKFHLVALLERVLNEVARVALGHPQPRERLVVDVVRPVGEVTGYEMVAKAMNAGPFRELFEEGADRTFFPGLDRVVISATEHTPPWYRNPKPMTDEGFSQLELEHNRSAIDTSFILASALAEISHDALHTALKDTAYQVSTDDTSPEGTS